ncbi:Glu-tRNA(Gln) amidotransferase subunit GatE [Candidatus Parvarchaeota archaeon]|nr:Glu-tRNA(Gln) amidotransferase subunit GatE [Candidatus Parvarchaeota archaeon]
MKIKCGFEWHVQLNTGKLFCRCKPVIHEDDNANKLIKRLLRPSFGEEGKVDSSAKFEGDRSKKVSYLYFNDTNCLVDIDEEPPHMPDENAIRTAFQMGNALNMTLLDDIIFMRKVIIDGSNTSGFQRTAVIGINGYFHFGKSRIPVSSLSLEEDSARKVKDGEGETIYKLDRLGIPLVEISTGVIDTDENEAKEIAMWFGRLTRLFNVKRGIGTIRQDVNISVEGGNRVELKGFQNIRKMDKVILNEVKRHESLAKISREKAYLRESLMDLKIVDLTDIFNNSESKIVRNGINKSKVVAGMRLNGYKGLLGSALSENKTFGGEISDYLNAKTGGGIIHSDELPGYGISQAEVDSMEKRLGCKEDDGFVISVCSKNQMDEVKSVVIERVDMLLSGVPGEVRLVRPDDSTTFLRPLGGRDRMYVETDLPIIRVDEQIKRSASKFRGMDIEKFLKLHRLSEDLLERLISVDRLEEAITLNKRTGADFSIIVSMMVDDYRYIKRRFGFDVPLKDMEEAVTLVANGSITKDAARFIFEKMALGETTGPEEAVTAFKLKKVDPRELEKEVKKTIKKTGTDRHDAIITELRKKLGFSFDAGEALNIVESTLKDGQD